MLYRHRMKPYSSSLTILAALLITTAIGGCSPLSGDWQLKKSVSGVDYYSRQSPLPGLPEYKAVIDVAAPMTKVKQVLFDFDRHPQWLHSCVKSKILSLRDYSSATVYQVTQLPIIRDRDIILHTTAQNDADDFVIQMRAQADYCHGNSSFGCREVNQSGLVRVQRAQGEFRLTALGAEHTRIQWIQYLDPAGKLPRWLYRANLSQVPIKTLSQLKKLLEE